VEVRGGGPAPTGDEIAEADLWKILDAAEAFDRSKYLTMPALLETVSNALGPVGTDRRNNGRVKKSKQLAAWLPAQGP
jgi:hypothetical protein